MSNREMTGLEKFIVNVLSRRAWSIWPAKALCLEKAKKMVMNGKRKYCFYKCDICKETDFKLTEVEVHHLEARVDPTKGWEGLEVWVARTFVGIGKLSCVCKKCHHEISAEQNETRRDTKKTKQKAKANPNKKSKKKSKK